MNFLRCIVVSLHHPKSKYVRARSLLDLKHSFAKDSRLHQYDSNVFSILVEFTKTYKQFIIIIINWYFKNKFTLWGKKIVHRNWHILIKILHSYFIKQCIIKNKLVHKWILNFLVTFFILEWINSICTKNFISTSMIPIMTFLSL